jgi:hypothetical protein
MNGQMGRANRAARGPTVVARPDDPYRWRREGLQSAAGGAPAPTLGAAGGLRPATRGAPAPTVGATRVSGRWREELPPLPSVWRESSADNARSSRPCVQALTGAATGGERPSDLRPWEQLPSSPHTTTTKVLGVKSMDCGGGGSSSCLSAATTKAAGFLRKG